MTDLVVVSLEAWDQVWRRNQHLVAGLLRTDPALRVLFVSPPADPAYAARTGRVPRPGRGLVAHDDIAGVGPGRLWTLEPTKWLPRRIDPAGDARLAARIRRAAGSLGMTRPRLWVNDPVAGSAVLAATDWPALYDVTDDWLLADRASREHDRLVAAEGRLLHDCAEVVVCSPGLAASKGGSRRVTLVPNAVDLAAYHRVGARPADLPPGRTVLYAGTVHPDRMDLELTLRTAAAIADRARLVLLGPLLVAPEHARRLEQAGVVALGPRPADSVPAYLRHADLLVVPHVVTPFTASLDPIKRYEYQAAGRPVVATPVAGFAGAGLPRVTVATPTAFAAAVAGALDELGESTTDGRLADVDDGAPDWSDRVSAMQDVLARLEPRRAPNRRGDADGRRPRVAIAHDYLTQRGGAERVVLAMARAFPGAPIYTTLYDPQGTYPEFRDLDIVVSPLNRVGWARRHHRVALPLLPIAAIGMRPKADVVISSTSGFAHGFRAEGRRLVYCHAPARWLYQPDAYLGASPIFTLARPLLWLLGPVWRRWDKRAAVRADRYLTNSRVVRDRVQAAYGIQACVLPPPLTVDATGPREPVADLVDWADGGFHLVVARLLPYKHVETVVDAFAGMPARRLVVVGDGPHAASLAARLPANVRLVRSVSDAQLRWTYAHTSALVACSFEDFGLTPLEAGAFGKPTIALGSGGYLDTVVPGVTGLFFAAATPPDIAAAVEAGEATTWSAERIVEHATSFSEARFAEALRAEAADLLGESDAPTGGWLRSFSRLRAAR